MTLDQIRTLIESESLATETGVASGYRSFEGALDTSAAFQQLLGFIDADQGNVEKIVRLVQMLSEQRVDYRYENPNDTALAAYVRAIKLVAPKNAQVAASFSITASNTWWARKIAEQVLSEPAEPTQLSNLTVSGWVNFNEIKVPVFQTSSNALQTSLISNFLGHNLGQFISKFQVGIDTPGSTFEMTFDTETRSSMTSEWSSTMASSLELAA
jgi:hypothetical protein